MSFEKSKKQIENKPVKLARFMKFCAPKPREFGRGANPCRICGKTEGVITKYDIIICRQCFREVANKLGFKKYN